MNLMKNTKKGSYIVEAALSMPVFILCIVAIALIINIIGICENIGYSSAKELHKISEKAYAGEGGGTLHRIALKSAVASENPKIRVFAVTDFRYKYSDNSIDELIGLETKSNFKVVNSIGINGKIEFSQKLLTRAFTGKTEDSKPLSLSEFQKNEASNPVVIFPRYGEKFHSESCRYVTQKYSGNEYKIMLEKEDAKAKGYATCSVCGGGEKTNEQSLY